MINLLPLSNKEAQHKERRLRVITVFLVLFLVVEIISLIALLAPYFLATTKAHIVEDDLALLEAKIAKEGGENYADVVKSTNDKLDYFFSEADRPEKDSVLISRVMTKIPAGIFVTDFSLGVAAPTDKVVTVPEHARSMYIGGVAATRSSLLAFVDALKKTEGIAGVDLPVSNFTESTNIDFSLTFITF